MHIHYVVAPRSYWDSIPRERELTCGRVRFLRGQHPTPENAMVFDASQKQMALQACSPAHCVVRETHYAEDLWHYQLIHPLTPIGENQ